ncbi:MAG: hypothetical protein RMM28_10345 [Thermoleophilia bacterium]|nr:hypothetical protein [Gaiellaceae bacterium]MDW8339525.1 hypothetical protein [Thermoleophilia bacterium]
MTTPRSRHAARLRARRRRAQARARWLALAIVVGALATTTLLLTAFDGSGARPSTALPAAPTPVVSLLPDSEVLATVGNVRIQSPIARGAITGIGFHGAAEGLPLQAVGPQANEGLLARLWRSVTGSSKTGRPWFQLDGRTPRVLDVGAAPGTDVYAPVDGTVVAIRSRVVAGRPLGAEIELRPLAAPSLVVTVSNVRPDRTLTVGANVAAGSSKLGRVVHIAAVEEQALARFVPGDGNNVSIQVFPSATLLVP